MFLNRVPDHGYLLLQPLCIQPGALSCNILRPFAQKNACHRAAGRGIPDPHLAGGNDLVPSLLHPGSHIYPDPDRPPDFLLRHRRLLRKIPGAIRHFLSVFCKSRGIHRHSDVYRKDIYSRLPAHQADARHPLREIFRDNCRHLPAGLRHSFFHYSIVRAHDDQPFFIQAVIRRALYPGNLNDGVLKFPEAEQRLSHGHPMLPRLFHGGRVRRFYLPAYLFPVHSLLHSFPDSPCGMIFPHPIYESLRKPHIRIIMYMRESGEYISPHVNTIPANIPPRFPGGTVVPVVLAVPIMKLMAP